MINYPVSSNTKFTIYKISTKEITKHGVSWPRSDGMPIVGQDPDYVFLEEKKDILPTYDKNYYTLIEIGIPDLQNQIWKITYSFQKRSIEEIVNIVKHKEIAELNKHINLENFNYINLENFNKIILLSLAAIFKQINDEVLTNEEIKLKQLIISKSMKIWNNHFISQSKISDILLNKMPNLDVDWALL